MTPELIVTGAVPVDVRVTGRVAEEPLVTVPKFRLEGLTARDSVGATGAPQPEMIREKLNISRAKIPPHQPLRVNRWARLLRRTRAPNPRPSWPRGGGTLLYTTTPLQNLRALHWQKKSELYVLKLGLRSCGNKTRLRRIDHCFARRKLRDDLSKPEISEVLRYSKNLCGVACAQRRSNPEQGQNWKLVVSYI